MSPNPCPPPPPPAMKPNGAVFFINYEKSSCFLAFVTVGGAVQYVQYQLETLVADEQVDDETLIRMQLETRESYFRCICEQVSHFCAKYHTA